MLIGSYLGSIGERRRVAVPKKFLSELGERVIIAKWYEDCLILVSENFWEELLTRLTGGNRVISFGVRDIERFILGSAYETEPDSQGRIIIPEILGKYAYLGKEVMFAGLGDRVEIWAREKWEENAKSLEGTTKEYIEVLAKDKGNGK
ncbi:MAG TPA: cell division/cell wall cluster transcriptional repressor MraZ [Patescibacteria group bacterium]